MAEFHLTAETHTIVESHLIAESTIGDVQANELATEVPVTKWREQGALTTKEVALRLVSAVTASSSLCR